MPSSLNIKKRGRKVLRQYVYSFSSPYNLCSNICNLPKALFQLSWFILIPSLKPIELSIFSTRLLRGLFLKDSSEILAPIICPSYAPSRLSLWNEMASGRDSSWAMARSLISVTYLRDWKGETGCQKGTKLFCSLFKVL